MAIAIAIANAIASAIAIAIAGRPPFPWLGYFHGLGHFQGRGQPKACVGAWLAWVGPWPGPGRAQSPNQGFMGPRAVLLVQRGAP